MSIHNVLKRKCIRNGMIDWKGMIGFIKKKEKGRNYWEEGKVSYFVFS